MRHRYLPEQQRRHRSRLMFLLKDKPLLRGSLSVLRNTCGKSNCKCARGEKHESLYVSQSRKGKRHTRCVPRTRWQEVREWVERYKEIQHLLEELSKMSWQTLDERSKKK